jgi:hypothetical protein
MNLNEDSGISRSLLINAAMMPRMKNSKVGFVRFVNKRSRFIGQLLS